MQTFPVLFDSRPEYLSRGPTRSLLLTPVGTGSVLSLILPHLAPLGVGEATVIAPFDVNDEYEHRLRAEADRPVTAVPRDRFEEVAYRYEPSDWLLLVNPAHFPAQPAELAEKLRGAQKHASATHLVSLTNGTCGARECVHFDTDGCVRRIQRYYDGVTWWHTCGITCSLVSVAAIRTAARKSITCLADLRATLTEAGAPASDVCLGSGSINLAEERGVLHLMEHLVRGSTSGYSAADRPETRSFRIGSGCRIDPGARLFGPVVVQDGVQIEAGARIIGPALLGKAARIGHDAHVAHCLILPGAVIPAHAALRSRVAWALERRLPVVEGAPDAPPVPALDLPGRNHAPTGPSVAGRGYDGLKRGADFVVALLGLILLAPVFVVVTALIRLESRGPILFAHRREGRGGREFNCWKFRTMVAGADIRQRALYRQNAVDGPQFKLVDDPRITRSGRWLRTTNIDELPQLINVLLGQMSLIGPRPSPFRENQICVPWRQARLSVRPGITGLWQLCRHERDAGDFHQWIHFDLLYVRHLSLALDLKILIGTLATFGGRWSIPLAWMLPSERLHGDRTPTSVPDWTPGLGRP